MQNKLICVAVLLGVLAPPAIGSPTIHVIWDQGGTPTAPFDYQIDSTNSSAPDIELKTGSQYWRIWSEESGTPANIGTISCSSGAEANFTIKILNQSDGPGAATVGGINL